MSKDEYLAMIEAIEMKAMQEIEYLRSNKIELMEKLNREAKAHNLEKKLRLAVEAELRNILGEPEAEQLLQQIYARVLGSVASQGKQPKRNKQSEDHIQEQNYEQQIKKKTS